MIILLFQVAYFLLPTYTSNIAAAISARLFPRWKTAIVPEHITWRGKSILGSHKTWRGFIAGTITGMLVYAVQSQITTGLEIHQYSWTLGFALSFGAVFGDAVESFFKRRLNIRPGKPFIPFDQIDHTVMAFALAAIINPEIITAPLVITGISITLVGHIICNVIGYKTGLRDTLW